MGNRLREQINDRNRISGSTNLLTGSLLDESNAFLKKQLFVAEPYTRGIGGWQTTRLCSEAFVEAVGAEIELPNMGMQKRPPGAMDDGQHVS
jgi:hypothetical protein